LVCFLELVVVNFGMMANVWMLENDHSYAKEQMLARETREQMAKALGSRKALDVSLFKSTSAAATTSTSAAATISCESLTAMEEADDEEEQARASSTSASATPDAGGRAQVRRATAGASDAGACSSCRQRQASGKPAAIAKPATAPPARRKMLSQEVMAALDVNGDGYVTLWEITTCSPRVIKVLLKRPFLRAVAPLRFLDIYWRFLFPMVYVPYILWSISKVDGGRRWQSLITNAASRAGCP
jgi:hypothetical protein